MAYSTDNPIKKIAQMGASNALWYYTDGDAIGTIDDDNYFIDDYKLLTAGDIIIVNSGGALDFVLSNVDILIVSVQDGGTNCDTVILA